MRIIITTDEGRELILSGGSVVRDSRPEAHASRLVMLMRAEQELGAAFIAECNSADEAAVKAELASA